MHQQRWGRHLLGARKEGQVQGLQTYHRRFHYKLDRQAAAPFWYPRVETATSPWCAQTTVFANFIKNRILQQLERTEAYRRYCLHSWKSWPHAPRMDWQTEVRQAARRLPVRWNLGWLNDAVLPRCWFPDPNPLGESVGSTSLQIRRWGDNWSAFRPDSGPNQDT